MSEFHAGKKCVVIQSEAGNVGKVVTLVDYLGYLEDKFYDRWWSIEESLHAVYGDGSYAGKINFAYEAQLMPLKSGLQEIEMIEVVTSNISALDI